MWALVRNVGVEMFWHAPDGTDPPWPEGTRLAQGGSARVGGLPYDVDEILMADWGSFTLDGPSQPPSTKGTIEVNLALIQAGSNPKAVRSWQGVLQAWGYAIDPAEINKGGNAVYGPTTKAANEAFQKDRHVGPEPWTGDLTYVAAFPG